MPRKATVAPPKLTKTQQILLWTRTKPVQTSILILLFIALVLVIAITTKSYKSSSVEPVAEVVEPAVVINPLTTLEEQIKQQNEIIQRLEAQNLALENNLKLLERRLQAHTDIVKRFCEYIVIITVDKKIIPRQCYNDYRWQREEGL